VTDGGDMQKILPYVARHAHGPQDTRPLQSALIRGDMNRVDILAWPVADIDIEVDDSDPPVLLATTLPTRVALSFTGEDWLLPDAYVGVLGALPLDSLVTLTVQVEDSAESLESLKAGEEGGNANRRTLHAHNDDRNAAAAGYMQ
jgi:hypothetical protein